MQAFVGALSGMAAQKGVFVTTSKFAPTALQYLQTVQHRVITVDGERLVDLMVQHGVGVRTRQVLELHRVDEDFFLEE
jgi:restriction system protein